MLDRLFRILGTLSNPTPAPIASVRDGQQRTTKQRASTRAARPRDFQRRRVYDWEAAVLAPTAGRRLSLPACERLIEEVFRWHEQPAAGDRSWRPPALGDGRGRRHACGSREVIKLPRWARTRVIVLHECAHGMSRDGHGPAFVRAYVALLCQFAGQDRAGLEASLRVHKVAIADPPCGR